MSLVPFNCDRDWAFVTVIHYSIRLPPAFGFRRLTAVPTRNQPRRQFSILRTCSFLDCYQSGKTSRIGAFTTSTVKCSGSSPDRAFRLESSQARGSRLAPEAAVFPILQPSSNPSSITGSRRDARRSSFQLWAAMVRPQRKDRRMCWRTTAFMKRPWVARW